MFTDMLDMINEQVLDLIFKAQVQQEPMPSAVRRQQMTTVHDSTAGMGFSGVPEEDAGQRAAQQPQGAKKQPVVIGEKTGRNDPCPCGSGKKYKKCHGAV